MKFCVVAGVILSNNWQRLADYSTQMSQSLPSVEAAFLSSGDYSLFQFGTMSGAEVGVYMFKHITSQISYGVLFSRSIEPLIIRRNSDGSWQYKKILGI